MTTKRLYYDDSYLQEFTSEIVSVSDNRVVLDQTAFYPTSGGQPFDTGDLGGLAVVDVVEEDDIIFHVIQSSAGQTFSSGDSVKGTIDWPRRWDWMQQHSGQHLLSALFHQRFGWETKSVAFGEISSTIELAVPDVNRRQLDEVQALFVKAVAENRTVSVTYQEASEIINLRKASDRTGTLRLVSIDGLDRSACGGTHVCSTGEIGSISFRGIEKIRGNVRLEFVCGDRAWRLANQDFESLSAIARQLSISIVQAPDQVAALSERLKSSEKERARLQAMVARAEAEAKWSTTLPDRTGRKVLVERIASGGPVAFQATADFFSSQPASVFIGLCEQPSTVIIAASAGSVANMPNIGQALKPLLAEFNGKGGGSAVLAQGTIPGTADLDPFLNRLRQLVDLD
jgi:alanyl-tRNA synthetase